MVRRSLLLAFCVCAFQSFAQNSEPYYEQYKKYYENDIQCVTRDTVLKLGDSSVVQRTIFCNVNTTYELFRKFDKKMFLSYYLLPEGDTIFIYSENGNTGFNGGIQALTKYIQKTIIYPREAERKNIQGRVLLSFIVSETGEITNLKLEKSAHPLLDAEIMRVIQSMPAWIPGTYKGVTKKFRVLFPFRFKLPD